MNYSTDGSHDDLPHGNWNLDVPCEALSCGYRDGHTHSSGMCHNTCWCDLEDINDVRNRGLGYV